MSDEGQRSDRPESQFTVSSGALRESDASHKVIAEHPDLTPRERQFLAVILNSMIQCREQGIPRTMGMSQLLTALMKEGTRIRTSTVRQRTSDLIRKGFLESRELTVTSHHGGVPPKEYRIANIHSPEFQSVDEAEARKWLEGRTSQRSSNSKKIIAQLRESDAQLAAFAEQSRNRTDNIWTGLADRVMRFSVREKPKNNRIYTRINILGAPLELQTTTQTGPSSQIATLQDQRVIRAIISEISHMIDERKSRWRAERASYLLHRNTVDEAGENVDDEDDLTEEEFDDLKTCVSNSFYIDVTALARKMGYKSPSSGAVRRGINESIRRLYETNFRLKIATNDQEAIRRIMARYGLTDITTDFRFITDLKSQYSNDFFDNIQSSPQPQSGDLLGQGESEEDIERSIDPYQNNDHLRVRFWQISIDNHLYLKLLRDTRSAIFAAHEEIMRESSGLAQTLYNWVSYMIGRTDPNISGKPGYYKHTLKAIHNALWPWRHYQRFEEKIVQIMRHYMDDTEFDPSLSHNVAKMWGYIWTLYKDETGTLCMYIRQDQSDTLTGPNSYYNRKLRNEIAGSK